jgi:hypothetical protein
VSEAGSEVADRKIEFACCFCGSPGCDKGLALVSPSTGEFEQQWWCHLECLLERMVRAARTAYVVDY